MRIRRVVILGSTGSIGVNALDVIARYPDRFQVIGLTAFNNTDLLRQQIRIFRPRYVAVKRQQIGPIRRQCATKNFKILDVEKELDQLVGLAEVDLVVIAISGVGALRPFLAAVRHGKLVAPANKEALVMAGDLLMDAARRHKATVIPIDSEQSAIFQCLQGRKRKDLKKVYLTASGGPLARVPRSKFNRLTVKQILQHPRWKMGRKITVDSANLMNKGFEVIEAQRLFSLALDQIQIVIHPEAVIHSMVSFKDGSIMAQLGITDMRLPIQFALSYPQCWATDLPDVDFFFLKRLTFRQPDEKKFPCLGLALESARQGKTYPCVLAAADDVAVDAFLNRRIPFQRIHAVVAEVLEKHQPPRSRLHLEDIYAAKDWAQITAQRLIKRAT